MKSKTKVVFLIHPEGKFDVPDLFAFFPEEDYTSFTSDLKTSYCHVGQHSACEIGYAKESRLATKQERAELETELKSIGYDLLIYKRKPKIIR
jgi:hypothetical protein